MRPSLTLIPLALSLVIGSPNTAQARGYDRQVYEAAALITEAGDVSSLLSQGTLKRLEVSPSRELVASAVDEAARVLARQHGISMESARATVSFRLASTEAPDEVAALMVAGMLGCTEDESCIELGQYVLAESSLVYNRCDELGFDNFTDCASEQSNTSSFLLGSATWAVAEHVQELAQAEQQMNDFLVAGGPAPSLPSVGGNDLGLGDCQGGPDLSEDEAYGTCWEMGPAGDPSPIMYGEGESVPIELQTVAPWMDPSNACYGLNPAHVGGQEVLPAAVGTTVKILEAIHTAIQTWDAVERTVEVLADVITTTGDVMSWYADMAVDYGPESSSEALAESTGAMFKTVDEDGNVVITFGEAAKEAAANGGRTSRGTSSGDDRRPRGTESNDSDDSNERGPARGDDSDGSDRGTSGGDAGMSSPHEGGDVATCAAQTEAMWDDCGTAVVDSGWMGGNIGTAIGSESSSTTPDDVDATCSFAQICQSDVFSGLSQYAYLCGAFDPSPIDAQIQTQLDFSEVDCFEDGPDCPSYDTPVDIDQTSQFDCPPDAPDCGGDPWSAPQDYAMPYSY